MVEVNPSLSSSWSYRINIQGILLFPHINMPPYFRTAQDLYDLYNVIDTLDGPTREQVLRGMFDERFRGFSGLLPADIMRRSRYLEGQQLLSGDHPLSAHHTGSHHSGAHHNGSQHPRAHHAGSHHPGVHHTGSHHSGAHHVGPHHPGAFHTESHHSGAHHVGSHHPEAFHTESHHSGAHHVG